MKACGNTRLKATDILASLAGEKEQKEIKAFAVAMNETKSVFQP
jgi:hypothetical protein